MQCEINQTNTLLSLEDLEAKVKANQNQMRLELMVLLGEDPRMFSTERVDRFWSKIIKSESGCWEWAGSLDSKNQYGLHEVLGKTFRSHRYAWVASNLKPIPFGILVCHKCDNKRCCNPDHLFLGTNADNMRDMTDKRKLGKLNGKRYAEKIGERNPRAKLSEKDVTQIVALYTLGGITQKALGVRFKVSETAIYLILKGKNWSHLKNDGAS